MFQQIDTKQFFAFGKQFADAAFRAQGLAVEHFDRAFNAQLKTVENRVAANIEFWSAASEVRDIEAARALVPKSVQLAKDSAEQFVALSQELTGLSVKTAEAFGDVARGSLETINTAARTGYAQATDVANTVVTESIKAAQENATRVAEQAKRSQQK